MAALEEKLANYTGEVHCGTVADRFDVLHIAPLALDIGIGPGDTSLAAGGLCRLNKDTLTVKERKPCK